ncbi:MAG TPA: site-2 protease family protein [Candidatus Aquilonibacter sp.]|nr:site-2 protease family protein [Candidatus Aquilonibacter sp.]
MSDALNAGNGHGALPAEILERQLPQFVEQPLPPRARRRPLWPALILFLFTVISTLAVGAEFARSYAANREPFSEDENPFATMIAPYEHPRMLLLGVPFSFTLLGILFTHEMGHYVACKIYGIDVTYPYFIPAPTLIGTFGAFIRIRSPITTRRALFDVGIAGPVAGFLVAAPAMAWAVATARVVPGVDLSAPILFGNSPLTRLFIALFHPHVNPDWVLLSPVGRAAWVGFFATALNLLPVWQLDGGHIVYSLTSRWHRRISLAVASVLLVFGAVNHWYSLWMFWGALLLVLSLRFRHPPVYDDWHPLDPARRAWAVAALAIFLCCFTLWPVR